MLDCRVGDTVKRCCSVQWVSTTISIEQRHTSLFPAGTTRTEFTLSTKLKCLQVCCWQTFGRNHRQRRGRNVAPTCCFYVVCGLNAGGFHLLRSSSLHCGMCSERGGKPPHRTFLHILFSYLMKQIMPGSPGASHTCVVET